MYRISEHLETVNQSDVERVDETLRIALFVFPSMKFSSLNLRSGSALRYIENQFFKLSQKYCKGNFNIFLTKGDLAQ